MYDKTTFLSGLAMGLIGKGDPTSDMVVSGGGASGNMLYNGVELPDINKVWTDKTTYPYASIVYCTSDVFTNPQGYYLYFSDTPFFVWGTGTEYEYPVLSNNRGAVIAYTYMDSADNWSKWYEGLSSDYLLVFDTPTWTNADILYENRSFYFAASDPVPVEDTFTKGYLVGAELRAKRVIVEREPVEYLTFVSAEPFTLGVKNATKNWDGTLHYSTDAETWNEWGGASTIASAEQDGEQKIYMRGVGNSVITGNSGDCRWVLKGNNIQCTGNIETLLDWETVESGGCPEMAAYCYYGMFYDCTSLVTAPALPAATLSVYCYANMFRSCTSLVTAPTLPATTLADHCYRGMFYGCTSLATAPALPAATLSVYCYAYMFQSCTSLVTAPALPATTLADYCYYCTFQYCTGLATAPTLPATTLAAYCYVYMFRGCTGLVSTPALPATTLAESCCYGMFYDCTSLATLPKLLATELPSACYAYMFYRCVNIKLSETQTDVYRNVYTIIPDTGALSFFMNSVSYMFSGTGGTMQNAILSTDREDMIMYTSNTIV